MLINADPRHMTLPAILMFCLLAACAPDGAPEGNTAAPAPSPPADGPVREIAQVSGNLYRARNDNHFTAFLVTPEGVILADPINSDFAEWLKAEIASRFNTTVQYVLYSHHHWDHASGGAVFADTAIFVGHEEMAAALEAPLPDNAAPLDSNGNGMLERNEATGGFAGGFDQFDANGDQMVTGAEINGNIHPPDMLYSDRMTLRLGGRVVELFHPGRAHSNDMTVLFFPEERAAFGVDYFNVRRLPGSLTGSSFDEYFEAVGAIEALDIDTVLPGHGNAGVREDLSEYIQFLQDVESAVAAGIARGHTVEELQQTVLLENYSDWLLYEDRRENIIAGAYAILTGGS